MAVVGLTIYNDSLKADLVEQTYSNLKEIKDQQSFVLKNEMKIQMQSLEDIGRELAPTISTTDSGNNIPDYLITGTKFDYITVSKPNNYGIISSEKSANESYQASFQKILKGQKLIIGPVKSLTKSNDVLILSIPIIENGEVVAALNGAYEIYHLTDLLSHYYNGMGYAFITDTQGKVIAKTSNKYKIEVGDNLFDTWHKNNGEFYESDTFDNILANIKDGKAGEAIYKINGKGSLTNYDSLGINDWSIFVTVPEMTLAAKFSNITQKTIYLAGVMALCFAMLMAYLIIMKRGFVVMHKNKMEELEDVAYLDQLTRINNYHKFKIEVQKTLNEQRAVSYILVKFDVQNFKFINNFYGYEKGNHILKVIAQALKDNLRNEHECCARLNTDEFLVLHEFKNHEEFTQLCTEFRGKFYSILSEDIGCNIRFPMGYYVFTPQSGESLDILDLFEKANMAHKVAKKDPLRKFVEYNQDLALEFLKEKEIENKMEEALLKDEFVVYLQPKYFLSNEKLGGAEALVRWENENKELFSPKTFIGIFEKNGFIRKLDMYMLDKVCLMIKGWIDNGIEPITVSVNFSRVHLSSLNFVESLCQIIDHYGIPRRYIEIELTETAIFDNFEVLQGVLAHLHDVGLTMAMDDFGSGYSSLGLLKDLPVDVIKLDRSFFANQKYKTRTKTVLCNVIKMARELNIVIVAEGVELLEHVMFLKELECDMIQGYYYGRPVPAEEFHGTHRAIAQIMEVEMNPKLPSMGDIQLGRGLLGSEIPVSVYRLFQFTMRQALIDIYGEAEMIEAFRKAGKIAGQNFASVSLNLELELNEFMEELKKVLKDSKIGILEVESADPLAGRFILTVKDDMGCSGVSSVDIGKNICNYEEGFIRGILYEYTGEDYSVVEVDCWGTGAELCRFVVRRK